MYQLILYFVLKQTCCIYSPCDDYYKDLYEEEKKKKEVSLKVNAIVYLRILDTITELKLLDLSLY